MRLGFLLWLRRSREIQNETRSYITVSLNQQTLMKHQSVAISGTTYGNSTQKTVKKWITFPLALKGSSMRFRKKNLVSILRVCWLWNSICSLLCFRTWLQCIWKADFIFEKKKKEKTEADHNKEKLIYGICWCKAVMPKAQYAKHREHPMVMRRNFHGSNSKAFFGSWIIVTFTPPRVVCQQRLSWDESWKWTLLRIPWYIPYTIYMPLLYIPFPLLPEVSWTK